MALLGEPEGGHFFAGGGIDRTAGAEERRDPAFLAECLAEPTAAFLLVTTNRRGPRLLFGTGGKIAWTGLEAVRGWGLSPGQAAGDDTTVLLGRARAPSSTMFTPAPPHLTRPAHDIHLSAGDGDEGWRFALDASSVDEQILLEHGELVSGRGLMQNDRADASVGGHALAMLAWHEKNMFSGVSGSPTEPIEAGLKRTGPVHLAHLYPPLPCCQPLSCCRKRFRRL